MSTNHLFRNAVKNPFTTVVLVVITIVMAVVIYGNIQDMHAATTGYDYCQNLCYLFENICICYFMAIFEIMYYLTYINKQYSKWCIWLFYLAGASVLIYFVVAGNLFECIFNHIESEYMNRLPSIARTLFTGPLYWMIVGYFFVPKILKDAQKLKQEQDLTI